MTFLSSIRLEDFKPFKVKDIFDLVYDATHEPYPTTNSHKINHFFVQNKLIFVRN